jgi:hypothetical protein
MRRVLSALLVASIAALPAMAHASPPDPVWITGLYDDGDQDDLISLAAWAIGVTGAPLDADATLYRVGALVPMQPRAPASSAPSAHRSRAPPAA